MEFGAPVADLTADDLTPPHVVFQFGMAPARVDVMTTTDAVTFPGSLEESGRVAFERYSDFNTEPESHPLLGYRRFRTLADRPLTCLGRQRGYLRPFPPPYR